MAEKKEAWIVETKIEGGVMVLTKVVRDNRATPCYHWKPAGKEGVKPKRFGTEVEALEIMTKYNGSHYTVRRARAEEMEAQGEAEKGGAEG